MRKSSWKSAVLLLLALPIMSCDVLEDLLGLTEAPAAPSGVTASQGTYADKIVVGWNPADGADSYRVFWATTGDGPYTTVGDTPETFMNVTANVVVGTHYFFRVAGVNGEGQGPYSTIVEGWAGSQTGELAAPTGLTASAGTYTDKVVLSWNAVAGADHYVVYQSSSASGAYTQKAGFTNVTATTAEFPAAPPTHMFFKVAAAAAGAEGPQSAYAEGWASSTPAALPAPTNVIASQGTYTDRVVLSWSAVPGAHHYVVYQSTTSGGTYGQVAGFTNVTAATAQITGVTPGVHVFYRVAAADASNVEGPQSAYAEGWASGTPTILPAPTGLYASQGTAAGWIDLSWNPVLGASYYNIHIAPSSSGPWAYESYTDLTTYSLFVSDSTHVFFVVAAVDSSDNEGDWSAYAEGWASGTPTILPAPTGLYASQGEFSDRIVLEWVPVVGASDYNLYFALSPAGPFDFVTNTTLITFTLYPPDSAPVYFVVAAVDSVDVEGTWSTPVEGWATSGGGQLPAPTGLYASKGTYGDKVTLSWDAVGGAAYYVVYMSASAGGTYEPINVSFVNVADIYVVAPDSHFFKVSAVDSADTEGALSDSVEGWSAILTIPFHNDGMGSYRFFTNDSANYNTIRTTWFDGFTLAPGQSYQVYTQKNSGAAGYAYGPMLYYIDSDNYVHFAIDTTGYWCVYQQLGGAWSTVVSWTYSDYLSTGFGAQNSLRADYYYNASDANYYYDLYINGTYVYSLFSATELTGMVGFEVDIGSPPDESLPDVPVDVRFYATSPYFLPSANVVGGESPARSVAPGAPRVRPPAAAGSISGGFAPSR